MPVDYDYTIQPSDVGSPVLHIFDRTWLVSNFMGRIMYQDIGKRVYLRDGVLQVESTEQRDQRLAKVT